MDFVSAWKAISVVLAGGFGLMGLLTENKNKKTGKLTTWGKVSLGGILVSTILGVGAQLKENSDDEKRREASTAQTLQLLTQTSNAVTDIQRLLSPFELARVLLIVEGRCEAQEFASFCAQAKALKDSGNWTKGDWISTQMDSTVWKMWPKQQFAIYPNLHFFRNPPNLGEFSKELGIVLGRSDLAVGIIGSNYAGDRSLQVSWENGKVSLIFDNYDPHKHYTNGKIASLLDLQNASLIVEELSDQLALLTPSYMVFTTKQGRELAVGAGTFEKISVGGRTAYLHKFENAGFLVRADKASTPE